MMNSPAGIETNPQSGSPGNAKFSDDSDDSDDSDASDASDVFDEGLVA